MERFVVLVVSQDSNRHFVFPPWYFSKDAIAADILFHTWSNTILIYGSEVNFHVFSIQLLLDYYMNNIGVKIM